MAARKIYTITWQGRQYELTKTEICRLTKRSRTFIEARLSEGFTLQQSIDAEPGDPRFKTKRRKEHYKGIGCYREKDRERHENRVRQANKSIINKFLRGVPCSQSSRVLTR